MYLWPRAAAFGPSDAPANHMSKSNVNPNHYKVAGRDRQGEDILVERNKQKHAQSLARERFEPRQANQTGPARGGFMLTPPTGSFAESAAKPSPAIEPAPGPTVATPRKTTRPAAKKGAKTGGTKRAAAPKARKAAASATPRKRSAAKSASSRKKASGKKGPARPSRKR